MMIPNRMKIKMALILLIVLLNIQLSFAKLLPDQLHCAAEVYNRNEKADTFDWYEVDEYVDWPEGRSSLRLANVNDGSNSIFYNQHTPSGGSSRRKFMVYDMSKNTCKSGSINSWPLQKIRKIVISMLPIEKLKSEVCDIPLGPSALLAAIEQGMADFRFQKQGFSSARLAKIDIYERRINDEPLLKARNSSLVITVRVVSQLKSSTKMINTTLADSQKVEILSLTICQVSNKKLKMATYNEEYQCSKEELEIEIDYFIVTERVVGSLIGRSLQESSNFDYHRDPFMRPIGIGCWKDFDFGNQRKFSIPSLQFSGEFVTSKGSADSTYVAYDGYSRLLRFDRDDRRSIYDLDRGQSYHSSALSPVRELSESIADVSKSCIVMDIDDEALMSSASMERVIGIGPTRRAGTHYMGTKMIDHVAYDVFEAELVYDELVNYGVPIIMESAGYVVGLRNNGEGSAPKRFFITYYVHDDQDTMKMVGTFRDDDTRTTYGKSMAPKFIELWEVSPTTAGSMKRVLINQLEFLEFSWSLEVQPDDDPDTQGDLSHLFYLKSCSQARSTQWQVRFRVIQEAGEGKNQLSGSQVAAFQANKQLIGEVFQNELASALDISRLQIAQMNLNFLQKSPDLLVDTRLIQLRAGLSEDKLLGYSKFWDTMLKLKDYIRSFRFNRHSLEACRLDSLEQPGANSFMFCRGQTVCVVFQREAMANLNNLEQSNSNASDATLGPKSTRCELHQYDWAPMGSPKQDSLSSQINTNIFELIRHPFVVKFRYSELDKLTKFAKFTGHSHAIKVKRLDSLGLEDPRAPLMGLRFTTIREEPGARNLNIPVKLTPNREDRFTYCQMACQLDEYCESFSVCLRKRAAPIQASDCILAAFKLTRERIEPISQILRKNTITAITTGETGDGDENKLEVRESDNFKSQVFRFKRDPDCNIHPKDIISSYKMTDTIRVALPSGVPSGEPSPAVATESNTDETGVKESEDKPQPQQEFGRVLSLEDCAAESFERGRQMETIDSNFTYCPLNSICLPNKPLGDLGISANASVVSASASASEATIQQQCNLYKRSHVQFYNVRQNTRLAIITKDNSKIQPNDLIKRNVGRYINGLTFEECARDCNLRRSNCLAFDSCDSKQLTGSKLCVLYSIRSPMSRANNKKLGLLPQEEQYYGMGADGNETTGSSRALLIGNTICNHYALRRVYFDIRLQQLLDDGDRMPQREQLDEMEESIIRDDQRRGEEAAADETSTAASLNDGKQATSGGGFLTNSFLFLVGLTLGCFGFIKFGSGAHIWIMDTWERIRTRHRLRNQGHRLSQLALANNPDV